MRRNTLYYGDNLGLLEQWSQRGEEVDLIYLDPPFNSQEDYNILFGEERGGEGRAQAQAFMDTWKWDGQAEEDYEAIRKCGAEFFGRLEGLREWLGKGGMMAYLVHLAPRLWHMRKLLKESGSLYLHCDDTVDGYVRILLDEIFGAENRMNSIRWKRTSTHSLSSNRYDRVCDVIFFYAKNRKQVKWYGARKPLDDGYIDKFYRHKDERGRYRLGDLTATCKKPGKGDSVQPWRGIDPTTRGQRGRNWSAPRRESWHPDVDIPDYEQMTTRQKLDALDAAGLIYWPQQKGSSGIPAYKRYLKADQSQAVSDIWTDIPPLGAHAKERLGYPTQKPVALLKRIIDASSAPGDLVLDPYCGCGTTIHATRELQRHFVGIDITHLAIAIIEHRFRKAFGTDTKLHVVGKPQDFHAACDLCRRDKFQFEAWVISLIAGLFPNEYQRKDRGVDGRGYAFLNGKAYLVLAQVKGGKKVGSPEVRDFRGTMARDKATFGILIALTDDAFSDDARKECDGSRRLPDFPYPYMQLWSIERYFKNISHLLPPLGAQELHAPRREAKLSSEQLQF